MREEYKKKLRGIVIPIAFQQLLLSAVAAGDSLMLGIVNGDAMAAVSLASNIEFVENLFLSALVGGGTILSAQYWGKEDRKTIEGIFGLILRYAVVISVLFSLAACLFPERLMGLFTDEKELIRIGADYVQMAVGSYLFTSVIQCYLCIMKTTGQTRQSVFISTFALVLDTLLNFLFIFGFHMEAKGAALTTSITRIAELVMILVYAKKMEVSPGFFKRVSIGLHKDFLKCSVPHLINSLLWGIGTTVYAAIIGHMGTAITTAYGVASIVRNLSISLCHGLSQGAEIVLANVLGAGQLEEGKRLGGQLSRFSIVCGVICGGLVFVFGPLLSHFMSLTEAVRSDLEIMFWISAFYVMTQCISMVVVCGILAAGGDTAFDAYSVAVTMWLIIIPISFMAAFYWNLSPLVVYLILSMDEIVKVPWIYAHYRKYKWVSNLTREKG